MSVYKQIMQLGLNSININTLIFIKKSHEQYKLKWQSDPLIANEIWSTGEVTKMGKETFII